MSCILKLFKSTNKQITERKSSFSYKFDDPLPTTLDELHPIELLLRKRLDRLNKRFETANKDLAYARENQNMTGILSAMKMRRESEEEFKIVRTKLNEVVEQRKTLEANQKPSTVGIQNPSYRPILTIQVPKS